MNIATQTFSVKSVPGGEIYINDKKVGVLDKNGEATFKDYPITKNIQLYVIYKNGKNSIKSETVTDMADEFGAFANSDYDDDDDYTDDASDDSTDDVTQKGDKYIWHGVIASDDAESLLGDVFNDADSNDDDFVGSAANKDFSDLKQEQSNWNDDDDISDWDTDVDIVSIVPASHDTCSLIYRVTYTFDHDDYTKKQVVEYRGAVIQRDGSDQKIQTIGKGTLISSKNYDD